MGRKNKLKRFADVASFPNVYEVDPAQESFLSNQEGVSKDLRGQWAAAHFHNDHPVILELACGKGDYTVALAKDHPKNNYIGVDITGVAALGNGTFGLFVDATNTTVGGTVNGAGNVIANNGSDGVAVVNASLGNAVLRNATYSNGGLGIDLGDDNVTANNGTKNGALPNSEMDFPVFTSAVLSGTTLTVAGYVGSAPSNPTFAGARVEVFKSSLDVSGNGEGQAFLDFLTADGSGNFSGALTVGGMAVGDRITATATDRKRRGSTGPGRRANAQAASAVKASPAQAPASLRALAASAGAPGSSRITLAVNGLDPCTVQGSVSVAGGPSAKRASDPPRVPPKSHRAVMPSRLSGRRSCALIALGVSSKTNDAMPVSPSASGSLRISRLVRMPRWATRAVPGSPNEAASAEEPTHEVRTPERTTPAPSRRVASDAGSPRRAASGPRSRARRAAASAAWRSVARCVSTSAPRASSRPRALPWGRVRARWDANCPESRMRTGTRRVTARRTRLIRRFP